MALTVWAAALLYLMTGIQGYVFINEIFLSKEKSEEFYELYNNGSRDVFLDGYHLALYEGDTDTTSLYDSLDLRGHVIKAGSYVLVASPDFVPQPDIKFASKRRTGNIQAVALYNIPGEEVPAWVRQRGLRDLVPYGSTRAFSPYLMAGPGLAQPLPRPSSKSTSRCDWAVLNTMSFRPAVPTPGQVNECFGKASFGGGLVEPSEDEAAVRHTTGTPVFPPVISTKNQAATMAPCRLVHLLIWLAAIRWVNPHPG